jgi:hypothetical protein
MINLSHEGGTIVKGKKHFLPLLQIIEHYPFPKPLKCTRTNRKLEWLESKIIAFTSDKFLKYVDGIGLQQSIGYVLVDNASSKQLNLSITQSNNGSGLSLNNIYAFLTVVQIKSLFLELVQCYSSCYEAVCSKDISQLFMRNFTDEERRSKVLISWLQYYGKTELEKRGGFTVFESNPYVQTQRIHDGLLVQVGDSPTFFETPEGELLLINAINALPLIKQ